MYDKMNDDDDDDSKNVLLKHVEFESQLKPLDDIDNGALFMQNKSSWSPNSKSNFDENAQDDALIKEEPVINTTKSIEQLFRNSSPPTIRISDKSDDGDYM